MNGKRLTIRYDSPDVLVLFTEDFSTDGETVAPNLSVHYNRDGEVMEVVVYCAAKILGPYLFPDQEHADEVSGFDRDMEITYSPETDTLRLQTGEPPYAGYTERTVAPGLCVNFDQEGWAMGVVIERAVEQLRPHLLPEGAGVA